jgi:hypothetical protein
VRFLISVSCHDHIYSVLLAHAINNINYLYQYLYPITLATIQNTINDGIHVEYHWWWEPCRTPQGFLTESDICISFRISWDLRESLCQCWSSDERIDRCVLIVQQTLYKSANTLYLVYVINMYDECRAAKAHWFKLAS